MTDLSSKLPKSFWLIGALALIWNLMGVGAFFSHVNLSPEALDALQSTQKALYNGTPLWATAAFAISVGTGFLGAILFVLRKRLAIPVFIISLISILLHDFYWFVIKGAHKVLGPVDIVMPIIVLLIATGLIFYSRSAASKNWLH